jgi:hypothetical protein
LLLKQGDSSTKKKKINNARYVMRWLYQIRVNSAGRRFTTASIWLLSICIKHMLTAIWQTLSAQAVKIWTHKNDHSLLIIACFGLLFKLYRESYCKKDGRHFRIFLYLQVAPIRKLIQLVGCSHKKCSCFCSCLACNHKLSKSLII